MNVTLRLAKKIVAHCDIPSSEAKPFVKEAEETLRSALVGRAPKKQVAILNNLDKFISSPQNAKVQNSIKDSLKCDLKYKSLQELADKINASRQVKKSCIIPVIINDIIKTEDKKLLEDICKRNNIHIDNSASCLDAVKLSAQVLIKKAKDCCTLAPRAIMYPINKTISEFFPKEAKELLAKTLKAPSEDFAQQYYKALIKMKGLSDRAPEELQIYGLSKRFYSSGHSFIQGGHFDQICNHIIFNKELAKLPKWKQVSIVVHELTHFEQTDLIIRTFGVERYIQAIKAGTVRNQSKCSNKPVSEIEKFVENAWVKSNYENIVKTAFAGSIKAERISPDSKLGQKALKYLEALEKYEDDSLSSVGYCSNLLEADACKSADSSAFQAKVMENLIFDLS